MSRGGDWIEISLGGLALKIIGGDRPVLQEAEVDNDIEMNGDAETWRELGQHMPTEFGPVTVECSFELNHHERVKEFKSNGGGTIVLRGAHGNNRSFTGNVTGRVETDFGDAKMTFTVKGGPTQKL